MKWLKHMANASSNEDIVEIEAIFGLEGYARWWKLLEAVACQMDKTDRCSVAYPWSKWQEILRGKRQKLLTFLEHLAKKRLISLEQNGEILEIKIPKLLRYRDEYSKKSGQTPEKLRTKDTEEETETDNPPNPPGEGVPFEEGEPHQEPDEEPEFSKKKRERSAYPEEFKRLCASHPGPRRGVKTSLAFERYKKLLKRRSVEEIEAAHRRYVVSEDWRKENGKYVPALAVWLNGDPCEDFPAPGPGAQVTDTEPRPKRFSDRPWGRIWEFWCVTASDQSQVEALASRAYKMGKACDPVKARELFQHGGVDEAMAYVWPFYEAMRNG